MYKNNHEYFGLLNSKQSLYNKLNKAYTYNCAYTNPEYKDFNSGINLLCPLENRSVMDLALQSGQQTNFPTSNNTLGWKI